jgi:uncharacterized protein
MLTVLLLLAGCTSTTEQLHLTIATGFEGGVYNKLGTALASEWTTQMGIEPPRILETNGSPDNLEKLRAGQADIAFSAADVAVERRGQSNMRALARIYDDYLHLVVLDGSPVTTVADLAGKRISVGAPGSGVQVIAERVLKVAGLTGQIQYLGLRESSAALRSNQIDAFFWSGGLPTDEITQLADDGPLRMLDLALLMPHMRRNYPHSNYNAATIPLSTYHLSNTTPVTTLVVPNLLLTTDRMSVDSAKALTQGIFEAQQRLANVSTAASSIDERSAIETYPIPLHEGALQYYRDSKL